MARHKLSAVINIGNEKQLTLGKVIGIGGYSVVQEGKVFQKDSHDDKFLVAVKRVPLESSFQLPPKLRKKFHTALVMIEEFRYRKSLGFDSDKAYKELQNVKFVIDEKKVSVRPSKANAIEREISMLEKLKKSMFITNLIVTKRINSQWLIVLDLQVCSLAHIQDNPSKRVSKRRFHP